MAKAIPVIKSSDLARSILFYTQVLDFEWKWPATKEQELANGVAYLSMKGADVMLSIHRCDGVFGSLIRIFVDDIDERYETFRARGLDTTKRPESPLHTAPIDQTWGLREFAFSDPDGNGICLCQPI